MGKRPRTGHLIAGLGDGKVHNPRIKDATDDLFLRRKQDRTFVRGSSSHTKTYQVMDEVYSGNGEADLRTVKTDPPISWQYSVMALIAMMGFLVALFLHLVTDNAPNTRGVRKRISTKKKKTDEWSDDCQTEDYVGDNEEFEAESGPPFGYYYPKEPEYPKHRKTSSFAIDPVRNFYFSAEQTNLASIYRSPSNSFYDRSPPKAATPGRKSSADISPFPQKAKKLSPVSSFASLSRDGIQFNGSGDLTGNTSGHLSDSSVTNLPLPRGVTRGGQSYSSQINYSPHYLLETPKAGPRRVADLLETVPLAPRLDISSAVEEENNPLMPFIPSLAGRRPADPPHSISVEELHSEMESGNIQHHSSFTTSVPSFARPPDENNHLRQSNQPTEAVLDESSDDDENDPRKNIIHKRKNLTQSTDTASSLLSLIRFDELQLEEVIGGGGFGQVWKATWRSTPVAVKVLTGSAQRINVSKAILEEFAAEINILKGMRHPNICLYMGACLDPPNRAIVTELAANGSVWDALRLPLHAPFVVSNGKTRTAWPLILYPEGTTPLYPRKGAWPWILVKRVASGAARGMTYLHSGSPPVLHRDLKTANLLLDESYTTKVCDFGLSRLKAQERSMTGNCGTVQWMAPEILANQPYAEPADVFSFGIILWELLTGECPYEGMTAIQCALAVLNRDHRPPIPSWCPPSLASLIGSCVKRDPSQRPTFAQVCLALEALP